MLLSVPELAIGVVPISLLVIALVELVKIRFRLKDEDGKTHRLVPLIAIGLGVVLTTGIQLSSLFPSFAEWYEMIIAGIAVGLAATGLYSGTRHSLNL